MAECRLCGRMGEDLSLIQANHKELGRLMICRDCWSELHGENLMVSGTTCGGSSSLCGSACSSCG